jgi:hypothetical protein
VAIAPEHQEEEMRRLATVILKRAIAGPWTNAMANVAQHMDAERLAALVVERFGRFEPSA